MESSVTGTRSRATIRAYASDLRAVAAWCAERNLDKSFHSLDARTVFTYCVSEIRQGRSSATIRRRLTAIRSASSEASAKPSATRDELFDIERCVARSGADRPSVLVLSNDPIVRAGLRIVLRDTGALCWSDKVPALDPTTIDVWDYVLVWLGTSESHDRFGAIRIFDELDSHVLTSVPVVAIHSSPLHPVVKLRLAEAGIRYAVPHHWLSEHLDQLSTLLAHAELPRRFHLETPFALRQSLGLEQSGLLAPFLEAACRYERDVWVLDVAQELLPLSRHNVRDLRRRAREIAGLPPPEFGRYSTSVRRAPAWPEWTSVRALVRAALGFESDP